jgi:hypothetical protein
MTSSSAKWLTAAAVAFAMCGGGAAWAEQYRVVASDTATICQSGTKTDAMVAEGRDDVEVAMAEGDTLNTAVCVAEGSQSNLHVQWQAAGVWKSSGNIGNGCAEILGASNVLVRAVETDFVQSATYYTCAKE